ncbi:MAG TPA: hydroxyacid dehydrogenase [Phycisphaerae bacterium]|nr:hydroxyacid dehydrogenase [Phycisphaerae bacterium]
MNVLVADKFETEGIEGLQRIGCRVTQDADLSGDSLRDALTNGAEVLVVRSTQVTADMLTSAKSLKLIIRAGSGYNTIDTAAARAKGIDVANCPGMNATAVAELAMGLMLALDRRIVDNTNDLRQGVWNKKEYSKALGLKGRTLGIVGLGKIGMLIAQRAKAFEMQLIYSDVVANPAAEKELGIAKVEFEDLLRTADFVSLHVPLTDSTRKLFDDRRLAMMKPTAILINCSRGEVVDSAALARALDAGKLRGAGLDVYETEPGASDKVFGDVSGKCARVYGTHHIGASTDQAQIAVAEETVRIVENFMKTGKTLNCVNA